MRRLLLTAAMLCAALPSLAGTLIIAGESPITGAGSTGASSGVSVALPPSTGAPGSVSSAVVAPVAQSASSSFTLLTGQPIHEALKAWAASADWTLNWQPTVSWKTMRGTTLKQTDVVGAVTEVVDTLRFEGKPVALRISDGNKVMEVISTEVRND